MERKLAEEEDLSWYARIFPLRNPTKGEKFELEGKFLDFAVLRFFYLSFSSSSSSS